MTEDGLTGCLGLLKRLQTLNLSLIPSVTDNVLDQLNGSEHLSELTLGVEVYYESVEFTMDALLRSVGVCGEYRCQFQAHEDGAGPETRPGGFYASGALTGLQTNVTSKCMHGMNQTEAEYPTQSKRSQTASLSQIGQ